MVRRGEGVGPARDLAAPSRQSGTILRVSMKWYRADRETSRILAMEAFETPFPSVEVRRV